MSEMQVRTQGDSAAHRNTELPTPELRTREQAIARAGKAWAQARHAMAQMTPREQAEAAWHPGHPNTVDELENRIRARRGLPPAQKAS